MSKFKVEMELTGLKIRIEGERADVPLIAQNLGQQVAGLFEPSAAIVDEQRPRKTVSASAQLANESSGNGHKPKARSGRRSGHANGESVEATALDWVHDPAKWGAPKQEWNVWQKAIWLLYVAKQEVGQQDMAGPVIVATFNRHFRQARILYTKHVTRELGAQKTKPLALVGEDTTKTPAAWFLTDTGIREAERLVQEAKGVDLPLYDGPKE